MDLGNKERLKFIFRRKSAYKVAFGGNSGKRVLADLKRYCRANKPTFSGEDSLKAAFLEGRRDVFLRIQEHIHISDQELHNLIEEPI
jgi:hypothetical protein